MVSTLCWTVQIVCALWDIQVPKLIKKHIPSNLKASLLINPHNLVKRGLNLPHLIVVHVNWSDDIYLINSNYKAKKKKKRGEIVFNLLLIPEILEHDGFSSGGGEDANISENLTNSVIKTRKRRRWRTHCNDGRSLRLVSGERKTAACIRWRRRKAVGRRRWG